MSEAPSSARLVALADQCVQCGLCLNACPTYRLDGLETESPRGRIALARHWALGTIEPTPIADEHLDHCLGCRACEVVCPAGVRYGPLLVEARTAQRGRRAPAWRQRLLEGLVARPRLLAGLLDAYRRLFPLLPAGLRPLPRPPAASQAEPPMVAGHEEAALFVGCIAQAYEAPLRDALLRLGTAGGVAVRIPDQQGCCGSIHAHAGDPSAARVLGCRNRDAFDATRTVLTLASGCHEAVARTLHGRAEVVDALAFLAARADRLAFRPVPERIALHLPCTQRNVVRSDGATRALLARVPGLEVVELDAGFGCCGAAGTQMLTDPARAAAFRAPLLEQLAASGATRMLSANLGCRLHFANAARVPVQHPLEFLAECLSP
jgi:glycolate oxidase iron-sulfur subunit